MKKIAIPKNRADMEKKYVQSQARLMRAAAETKRIGENLVEVAVGAGTAYLYGVIEDKLPYEGKIPGTEMGFDLAGGAALCAAGAVMKGKMAGAVQAMGCGLLFPALREYGRAATFF
jgi:hypothetical protein